MVSWGPNTVHTIPGAPAPGAPAPAPIAFNFNPPSPAPATAAFGSTTSPAPGGLLGSAPPAPTGGLFPAPAPPPGGLFGARPPGTTNVFGMTPAPAPGSFFGSAPAPSGGLFGSAPAPPGGLFAGAPPAPVQPQIPAQAALQAHMDAEARQEEQRVSTALQKIQMAYQGTEPATESRSAHFTAVAYNPATPEMRQFQLLHGIGRDGSVQPVAPPKPAQISTKDWNQSIVRNPDYQNNMPVPLVGAAALLARATGQQEQVNAFTKKLATLHETTDAVQQHHLDSRARLDHVQRVQDQSRTRLLKLMQKVELARCLNQPLQEDEIKAIERMGQLKVQLDQLEESLGRQRATIEQQRHDMAAAPSSSTAPLQVTDMPAPEQLKQVLSDHRKALTDVTVTMQRDSRDVALVKQRVEETRSVPVPRTMYR